MSGAPNLGHSTRYRDALRTAKEAVIEAVGALHEQDDAPVLLSQHNARFGRLAEVANELRDMERDADAVIAEHAVAEVQEDGGPDA